MLSYVLSKGKAQDLHPALVAVLDTTSAEFRETDLGNDLPAGLSPRGRPTAPSRQPGSPSPLSSLKNSPTMQRRTSTPPPVSLALKSDKPKAITPLAPHKRS